MISSEEKNDVTPICPHCSQEIARLWFRRIFGLLGKRYVYFCSECRACLGVSHRKGFWMG